MYEIIINKTEENIKKLLLVKDGELLEKYELREDKARCEGNIYLGKVQNILTGMQAAFVDIGKSKNTFIHLKDLLPKVDEKNTNNEQDIINTNIKSVVQKGMSILVQIKRDSTSNKGARVSTHISITGKYIVLMPETDFVTISQKIEDIKEAEKLKQLVQKLLPKGFGAIIRTAALGKSEEELEKDIKLLCSKWIKIKKLSKNTETAPKLIYKSDSILKKMFVDMISETIDKVVVNSEEIYKEILEILKELENTKTIVELSSDENILYKYDLKKQLEKTENRKIWLDCGGFITIDKTEALIAIDVNSGKYIGLPEQTMEDTVFTVNKEATIEIAKQLRLRDLGGIIIIDYIDMVNDNNKKAIMELLAKQLKSDRTKTQIIGFTPLNLLEMTRKHIWNNE
ncbi:MAG: Rne/Rng family ribonuclease [Lachnospiraceae bacterium]|jgi:ribonuclease G|nr:Rne/Rng family ribonuclease [Lachnospiraceae bacterium]